MFNNTTPSADDQPLSGIIDTLDTLESTISNLELDVRTELNTQRLLYRCQLNLAGRCPSVDQVQSGDTDSNISNGAGSILSRFGKCNCRCNQALEIYLDQLRQSQLEQERLLRTLKMKEEQMQLYRSKLLETNAIVEHQNQEIRILKDNEELVTKKINTALEQENQTLLDEIDRLKRLPDELRVREHALKAANKELQETKLTLKSLLLDIESGLETCEDISGELQQERKRAFHTLNEIDEEKRKAMNWVAKYTELKKQYESAVQQKESVQQLSAALREKTIKLDALSKEYEAIKMESAAFISETETLNEKKRTELQERVLELECENLRLKIALEDQCQNTSKVTHNMQRELLNLEKRFVEAHGEINTLKRYNETAAAHAEYAARLKSLPEAESPSAESQSLSPPYCNTCFNEGTCETCQKLKPNQDVSSDSFSSARENNEPGSTSGNSDRTTDGNTESYKS